MSNDNDIPYSGQVHSECLPVPSVSAVYLETRASARAEVLKQGQ